MWGFGPKVEFYQKRYPPTACIEGLFSWKASFKQLHVNQNIPYNIKPMLFLIPFNFHFVEIINLFTDWIKFNLVFSVDQHLLWQEDLLPFALPQMLFYIPHANCSFSKCSFKKGISEWQNFVRGYGRAVLESKCKMLCCWLKNALLYPCQNVLLAKFSFKKNIRKSIFSRDIEEHFWESKFAFPPNIQKQEDLFKKNLRINLSQIVHNYMM